MVSFPYETIYEPLNIAVQVTDKILLVIELIVVFINIIMDTNFMMLNKPYNIYILEFIYSISKDIYPFFMALVQIIITFFVPYTLIFLINKLKLIFYHKFFTKKR